MHGIDVAPTNMDVICGLENLPSFDKVLVPFLFNSFQDFGIIRGHAHSRSEVGARKERQLRYPTMQQSFL